MLYASKNTTNNNPKTHYLSYITERKVVRSRPSICKNQNIKIYDSSVVCVIYHGLVFFLEKHGLGFAMYSRVCMEIRVFCL